MNNHKYTKLVKMTNKKYKVSCTNRNIFVWFNDLFDCWVCTLHKPYNTSYNKMYYKEANDFIKVMNILS